MRAAHIPAAALPFLFLHVEYQPSFDVGISSTTATIRLTDLAVAAVIAAAAIEARRHGLAALAGGAAVWVPAGLFLIAVAAGTAYGPLVNDDYPFATNAVSATKFVGYALLAPALALLVRARRDLVLLLTAVAAWSVLATIVGAAQFVGLLGDLDDTPAGRRKPSFVGYHDFSVLSGAALAVAFVGFGLAATRDERERRGALVSGVTGALGAALGGALATIAGLLCGAAGVTLLALRRRLPVRGLAVLAALTLVATAGALALRSSTIADAFGNDQPNETRIESYPQRAALGYIGYRVWRAHPLLGAGWLGSSLEENYGPELPAARRRFRTIAADALPSPEHPWGVQNAFVQAAADLGVVGFASLAATFLIGLALAARRALAGSVAAAVALVWLLVAGFEWASLGLVAGVPTTTFLWLALGLAVASRDV